MELKPLLERFYGENYKHYIILPAVLFFVFAFLIFVSPGLQQGIDLKGGTLIVIGTTEMVDAQTLHNAINSRYDLTELSVVPFQGGIQVQFGANKKLDSIRSTLDNARALKQTNPQQALSLCETAVSELSAFTEAEKTSFQDSEQCLSFAFPFFEEASTAFEEDLVSFIKSEVGETKIKEGSTRKTKISPALGELFWSNARLIMIIAAIAIIIVIFVFFRAFVPSIAVILAASFDILAALGLMSLFGINFSLASISALLMLIGYSVDTDIMLTTRLLKRRFKQTKENAADSLLTGLTMTGTTLGAVTAMIILSSMWNLSMVFGIAIVLFFGLLGDLISTWFMNAPILIWYLEKKKGVSK